MMADTGRHTLRLNYPFPGYRDGLAGVWDHFVEVLLRKPPRVFERPAELSLALTTRGDVEILNAEVLMLRGTDR